MNQFIQLNQVCMATILKAKVINAVKLVLLKLLDITGLKLLMDWRKTPITKCRLYFLSIKLEVKERY